MNYCPLVSAGSRNMKIKNCRKTKMAFGKNFDEKSPPWVIFFFTQKFSSILWKRPRSVDWELLGKVDIIFFSSVKLIDVFWLPTNTCENNTHSIWEARKTRRKGELHKIPITKRFIALRCYFSRLQYGLLVFCKVWWCKGSIKKKKLCNLKIIYSWKINCQEDKNTDTEEINWSRQKIKTNHESVLLKKNLD